VGLAGEPHGVLADPVALALALHPDHHAAVAEQRRGAEPDDQAR
jgi:hypothetical protein